MIHSPFPANPRVIFLKRSGRKMDTESVNSSYLGRHIRFANFVDAQVWGQSCQRMLERFFFNAKTIEHRGFCKLFISKFPPHASLTELFPEHFWTHQPSVTHCLASWKGNRRACAVRPRMRRIRLTARSAAQSSHLGLLNN